MDMNIDDFVPGSAYISIRKDTFSDKQYFEDLLSFLKLPKECTIIEVGVIGDSYKLTDMGEIKKVAEKSYRGR